MGKNKSVCYITTCKCDRCNRYSAEYDKQLPHLNDVEVDLEIERFDRTQVQTACAAIPTKDLKVWQLGYLLYMPGEGPKKNGKPGKAVDVLRVLANTKDMALTSLRDLGQKAGVAKIVVQSMRILPIGLDGINWIVTHFAKENPNES